MRVLHHNTHVQEVSHAESPRKKTLILNKFLRAHCYSMKALIKTEEMASDEPIKMKSGTLTRKRPRSMGSFPCPSCDKIFKRSDHLSRHYLNHDPKEVYECDFLIEGLDGTSRKCGRTFVRRDLKERHTKRHVEEAALKRRKTEEIQSPLINQDPPVLPQMTPPEGVSEGLVQPQVMVLPPQTRAQPQPQTQTQTNTHTQTLALALALVPPVQPVVQVQQPHTFHPAVPMNMQPNVQSMNTGGTQGMQPQPQSQSLADFDYSQHNPNMPPTQNDILSWLFIDSPPNVVLSPEQQKLRDQLMALPYTQLRNMNGSLNPSIIAPTPPLSILPPPMSFSFSQQQLQPPPLPQHTQQQQAQFQNQNAQFPLQMMLEDPSLTPFYSNSQYNTNVNLFSNSDNPLDEIFLKSLPENSALNVNNPFFVNGTTGSNSTNGTGTTGSLGFNFMPSTASSSSPITTNDSTPRARTGSVNGSTTSSYVITITDVINNHAKWSNVPKMGHLFIDTLILELCLSSVNVSRSTVEKLFDPGKDGESTNLSEVSLLEDRFSYYLSLYWTIFHPQYTIIHRPSFSTKTCPPLLLLAMVILGCNYAEFQIIESKTKSAEFKFSVLIATPLRFMIFQDEDFKSPVKLWILQSLNILEWCEKNFLTRDLHERAHIHHGTTAQLLRRSPLLGGNPTNRPKKKTASTSNGSTSNGTGSGNTTSAAEDDSDAQQEVIVKKDDTDYDVFVKWVEAELMKRNTFMTFLMDIMDYVKFRHNPHIMFYQLQLLYLPCDDENLWECADILGSFKKVVKRQKKLQQQQQQSLPLSQTHSKFSGIKYGENFLSALKKLIRYNNSESSQYKNGLSVFTKKILFGGLLLIMYQMQQADIQNNTSSLLGKSNNNWNGYSPNLIWKESLTKAFDRWNIDYGSCTVNNHIMNKKPSFPSILNSGGNSQNQNSLGISRLHLLDTSVCQFPIYHLTQIIGMSDLNQYDIAIFGGSPANMSVDATMKDHVIVQAKLNNMWSKYSQQPGKKKNINELINLKSVIHSYLILWELMLKPQILQKTMSKIDSFLDWHATPDHFDSMYAVGVATLTLWCFTFTTCGIESVDKFEESLINNEKYQDLVSYSKETAHDYLYRIRKEFSELLVDDSGEFDTLYSVQPFTVRGTNKLAHDVLCKYAELLPQITNKQHISGLCFLVGTKLMCSQWEILRENARLILNCGLRSIGKKSTICQNLFDIEWSD